MTSTDDENPDNVEVELEQVEIDDQETPARESDKKPAVASDNTPAMTMGKFGHIFRRVYHILLFTSLSFLYYRFGPDIDEAIGWGDTVSRGNNGAEKIICLLALFQIVVELVRIKMGFICVGFRSYERHQISAQAWGTVGAVIVLLSSPIANGKTRRDSTWEERAYIGMPILWSLGIVDPLIGEMKGHGVIGRHINNGQGFSPRDRCIIATAVVAGIWAGIWGWLGEAEWWFLPVIAPLTVAAEYPSLHIIDDNAMMELVPLGAALLFQPFFGEV